MASRKEKEQTSDSENGVKSPPNKPKIKSSSSNGGHDPNKLFEVRAIVGDRILKGKKQYKIHWRGYPANEATWENFSNLECPDTIIKYESTKHLKKRRKSINVNNSKKPESEKNNGKTNKYPTDIPNESRKPEKIVAFHLLPNGKREVLIRWKNLKETHDSWMPEALLIGTEIHREFLSKEKKNLERKLAWLEGNI